MILTTRHYLPVTLLLASTFATQALAQTVDVEQELAETREEIRRLSERLAELSMTVAGDELGHFIRFDEMDDSDRAMIGVSLMSQSGDEGARIAAVTPDGPAARAGLATGDLIVAINDVQLGDKKAALEVNRVMDGLEPGDTVSLTVQRDGRTMEKQIVTETLDFPEVFSFSFNGETVDMSELENLKGLQGLAALEGLKALEGLEGLKGLEGLAVLKGLEGLEALEGLESLEGLAALEGLEALEHLDVEVLNGTDGFEFVVGDDWPDFEVVALTPELGDYFGVSEGLLLVRAPKTDDLDLRDGDVLVEIDGRPVSKERDLWRALQEHARDESVPVKIVRQRESLTLNVSMPSRHGSHPRVMIRKFVSED